VLVIGTTNKPAIAANITVSARCFFFCDITNYFYKLHLGIKQKLIEIFKRQKPIS
jgi:hypothetical protein